MNDHAELLRQFVATFEKFDEMMGVQGVAPVSWQLTTGKADEYGRRRWRPIHTVTSRSALDRLYARLPLRFPTLFETLLLSYRWEEVDLDSFRLTANPPGSDLSGFYGEVSRDPAVSKTLLHAGYLQFGKGPDLDYNPVCFEAKSRDKVGECRIVKINREEILAHGRIRILQPMAASFKDLILQTIARAQQK